MLSPPPHPQVVGNSRVVLGWYGRVYPLRKFFDDADISLCKDDEDNYIRVLSDDRGDLDSTEKVQALVDILTNVSIRCPCIVVAEGVAPENMNDSSDCSKNGSFLKELYSKIAVISYVKVEFDK